MNARQSVEQILSLEDVGQKALRARINQDGRQLRRLRALYRDASPLALKQLQATARRNPAAPHENAAFRHAQA